MKENDLLQLTQSQKNGLEAAMSGKNVLLLGGAGTGKTRLILSIARKLKEKGKNVILCAPTGTAASGIGGTTIHRVFGFSGTACINEKSLTVKVSANRLICSTDVLIIDEISMCRADLFDAVVSSIKKAFLKTGRSIQLILAGDFYQLPPVLNRDSHEKRLLDRYYGRNMGNAYAFMGNMWKECDLRVVVLKEIVRQKDPVFASNLNRLRTGDLSVLEYFNTETSKEAFADAPWLFPYNKDADRMNMECLNRLEGLGKVFHLEVTGAVRTSDTAGIPDPLVLKKGARVIITVNETDPFQQNDMSALYHNGSSGTVTGFSQTGSPTVYIRLDNGRAVGIVRKTYPVYKYRADGDGGIEKVVAGTFCQYPLRLAYAATIHRSQGQTYDAVNLDPDCRNPGQLYVALSRSVNIRSIHLTRRLLPEYVVTDPIVNEFYKSSLEHDEAAVEEPKEKLRTKGGRPRRFPNGSTILRIPSELSAPLEDLLCRIYPANGLYDGDLLLRFQKMLADL